MFPQNLYHDFLSRFILLLICIRDSA